MSSSRRAFSRRDLLRSGLAAAALAACSRGSSSSSPRSSASTQPQARAQPKRILILGGTGFLGPKTIDAALARGHTITIFNRGKREKLLPLEHEVEHLYGNRDPKLPADDEQGPDGKLLAPTRAEGLEQLDGQARGTS